ncbi:hypothetical protein E4U17_004904 [Claviceps sp. LM77 group G4]|nr:hypothetical protein E4U17_004904 [Claviceps sp. LM77 group G4]KAG6056910.1 hypothetical protein E4U33_007588 [Claviceps sp. LM78 group G4]
MPARGRPPGPKCISVLCLKNEVMTCLICTISDEGARNRTGFGSCIVIPAASPASSYRLNSGTMIRRLSIGAIKLCEIDPWYKTRLSDAGEADERPTAKPHTKNLAQLDRVIRMKL